jgi:hypothetical protein
VDLSEISKTGGLVNAYEAIKLASKLSKAKEKLRKKYCLSQNFVNGKKG